MRYYFKALLVLMVSTISLTFSFNILHLVQLLVLVLQTPLQIHVIRLKNPYPCNRTNNLWHDRLGHPNHHVLKFFLQHCKILISNKNIVDFCFACAVGKPRRLPSSPLELVYCDIWGPSHITSINGFLYYITFVDAFSRFTWIYLLRSKAETFIIFQKFKAMVELLFISKIENLQTYWGGEFQPLTPFWPIVALNKDLFALTPIIKMVLLRENIDILWNLVSPCCIMLPYH